MNQARKRRQERRKIRHQRNKDKDREMKKEAWSKGKLIKPDLNTYFWEESYLRDLEKRLYEIMKGMKDKDNSYILQKFRLYKDKVKTYILKYNPSYIKTEEYKYLKKLLEIYWDEPENLKNYL